MRTVPTEMLWNAGAEGFAVLVRVDLPHLFVIQ